MAAFLGLEWSTWVIVGVFVVMFLGVAWGYFTRTGSEVGEHPIDDRARSPGAREPANVAGEGRTPENPTGGRAARGRFSGHGTR
jgi:hypothetical protein